MISLQYPNIVYCMHIQHMLATKRPVSVAIVIVDSDHEPPHGGPAQLLFTLMCRAAENCVICDRIQERYSTIRIGRVPDGTLAISPIEVDGVVVAEATTPPATDGLPE